MHGKNSRRIQYPVSYRGIYNEIKDFYEGVRTDKKIIGKSLLGRDIFAVKLGHGCPVCIIQYAIHGREFLTAKLAKEHFRYGSRKGTVWLVPLVNPDGAMLSECGLSSVKDKGIRKKLLAINGGKTNFSLWKANAGGVDLNVNFPADWGKGKSNVFSPAPENCVGERPLSEPESRALADFTREISPDLTVSFHTKGEEIYWYYGQPLFDCVRDKKLALALSAATGYPLRRTHGSVGGYKDWCISVLGIPSFTIEAGRDEFTHPLRGKEAFADIAEHCRSAVDLLTDAYIKLQQK